MTQLTRTSPTLFLRYLIKTRAVQWTSQSSSWLVKCRRFHQSFVFHYFIHLNFQLQTLEDKLNWIFDVFDRDGGGTIDPAELRDIVRGLFCLAGIEAPDEILDIRSQVRRL